MAKSVFLDESSPGGGRKWAFGVSAVLALVVTGVIAMFVFAALFRIDVPPKHVAVLTRLTGLDMPNGEEIAPGPEFKGVQKALLPEGRYFYNPLYWEWEVVKQLEIPEGKLGVMISLTGEDLPYGEFLAVVDPTKGVLTKGIVPEPLRPGRYPINPYLFQIEEHTPIVIPAGFKGVVTNLAGKLPAKANQILSASGERGVQKETLEAGTYYINPYVTRVNMVDCRSQRFNLSTEDDMGFPSKDGFWVSLDGIIEFRVNPERAAEVYVIYNEVGDAGDIMRDELIHKVVLPHARSFCRLEGSNKVGRDFIQGDKRTGFQDKFQESMQAACEPLGIEVIQALITKIKPPEQIAKPVRDREIAKQQEQQFQQQILQQKSEEKLAMQKELVKRGPLLIDAEQEVVKLTTEAEREQEVAKTKADEQMAVAQLKLDAAQDEAAATTSRGKAAAEVVQFKNKAEAAGWKRSVEAFNGNGSQFAQFVMYQKLSAAYRDIMVNTADSPIMKVFDSFAHPSADAVQPTPATPATPPVPSTAAAQP